MAKRRGGCPGGVCNLKPRGNVQRVSPSMTAAVQNGLPAGVQMNMSPGLQATMNGQPVGPFPGSTPGMNANGVQAMQNQGLQNPTVGLNTGGQGVYGLPARQNPQIPITPGINNPGNYGAPVQQGNPQQQRSNSGWSNARTALNFISPAAALASYLFPGKNSGNAQGQNMAAANGQPIQGQNDYAGPRPTFITEGGYFNEPPKGSWFHGAPQFTSIMPNYDQQQMQAVQGLLPYGLAGLNALENNYDFEPIADYARNQFQQKTVPSLAERFTALGGGQRSSAFGQQLGAAGAELEHSLAALRSDYNLQQQQLGQSRYLSALGLGLSPRYESSITPRGTSYGMSLAQGFLGNIGQNAGQAIKYAGALL